ncbi:uroporphyrinogen-III C-methyltransferase [Thermodesulforhabdus norvegica]|uniref:uroporphyrinogen-III C-methyltransferase n=1 Tax=Thermodesulforhabdus norvegica TaxID=39841 RepID=A0A1I4RDB2_9BACT|nr:uroporphyrinogen-III C-methyltransferase [Thermodesulforhabdus norvegica]SFM49950.1 uroporphyrinogen III methyltransferase / synthase [Thermodesulforhabdus norvegica]
MSKAITGKVYLVGAGPGDPGLITVKGLDLIAQADCIIYDYLANEALLSHARPNAEKIYVGKQGGRHSMSQEEINRLLVEKGRYLKVVRLKGGDPFVFGRGGEEAEVLKEAGIPFEVVPGVTSAVAAPAYAGIPLSHRDFTASIAFVTGHEREDRQDSKVNWKALAELKGTLAFFMGVKNLPYIVDRLIHYGAPKDTPVAVIRWGTTPRQKSVTGTLGDIVERVKEAGITPPAIIVVGSVVTLRDRLNWFETRPLFGKRIIITRTRTQASELRRELEALGADCIEFPTIEIIDPPSWDAVDEACKNLESYDWVIFTSVNGVDRFFDRLLYHGLDGRALGKCRIAAIGPATARRLQNYFIRADVIPDGYRAEELIKALPEEQIKRAKVLIPRALVARDLLPETLKDMGAHVDVVPVYQTVRASGERARETAEMLKEGSIDFITFTSSSTVTNFVSIMEPWGGVSLLRDVKVASIGPITTETAHSLGIKVTITAREYTIRGLVEAITEFFTARV